MSNYPVFSAAWARCLRSQRMVGFRMAMPLAVCMASCLPISVLGAGPAYMRMYDVSQLTLDPYEEASTLLRTDLNELDTALLSDRSLISNTNMQQVRARRSTLLAATDGTTTTTAAAVDETPASNASTSFNKSNASAESNKSANGSAAFDAVSDDEYRFEFLTYILGRHGVYAFQRVQAVVLLLIAVCAVALMWRRCKPQPEDDHVVAQKPGIDELHEVWVRPGRALP